MARKATASSNEAFPAQLETMLHAKGINVTVSNAGIGGDTTAGMLARFDSVSRHFDARAGAATGQQRQSRQDRKDQARGRRRQQGQNRAETKANIDQIRAKAAARHIKVIDAQRFIAALPDSQGWGMQSDIRTPRATVSWRRPCFRWLSLRSEIEGDAGPVGMRRHHNDAKIGLTSALDSSAGGARASKTRRSGRRNHYTNDRSWKAPLRS